MKSYFSSKNQAGSAWQQRLVSQRSAALGSLRWLLAQGKAALAGIADKPAAAVRRSVVITVRRSDAFDTSASHNSWSERQSRTPALIPVQVESAQRHPHGQRRRRHE